MFVLMLVLLPRGCTRDVLCSTSFTKASAGYWFFMGANGRVRVRVCACVCVYVASRVHTIIDQRL